ncbi:MAG: GNAT family N-acetyltransferase [Culicoidibacterales bacterium]
MSTIIRHEQPADFHQVELLTREAFYNLYVPGCEEHYLVHQMRNHPDYLPELSFIIEVDGKIIGSLFTTRSKIIAADGSERLTLTFGPVSIHPDYHRKGFGRQLITHFLEAAKKTSALAVVILGYPHHYEPYGFIGGKHFGVAMPDGNFYKGLQVLPLTAATNTNLSGQIIFSDVFALDPEATAAFDATFPVKEKQVLPSQAEFAVAASALDN